MSKVNQILELSNYPSIRNYDQDFNELGDINEHHINKFTAYLQKLSLIQENLKCETFQYLEENFSGLLVILKNSGKVSFNYFKDNKLINPDLIGGYLYAIQSFST